MLLASLARVDETNISQPSSSASPGPSTFLSQRSVESSHVCELNNVNASFYVKNGLNYFEDNFNLTSNMSRIYKLNQMAKCAYIMNNLDACEGGGYISWSHLQLCAYESPALQTVMVIVAILFFFYLFLLLTTTADDFFCSNIAAIIDFHKISQNVAGITFMAFGNGAPDLFTSVASVISVNNPQPGLAISELLGGGIFVTTVVVAAVAFTQPFDVTRRPVLRDIIFYLFPLATLGYIMFQDHKITVFESILLLLVYVGYSFIVISGSFLHKRIKKNKYRSRLNREAILKCSGFFPRPATDVQTPQKRKSLTPVKIRPSSVPVYSIHDSWRGSTITGNASHGEAPPKRGGYGVLMKEVSTETSVSTSTATTELDEVAAVASPPQPIVSASSYPRTLVIPIRHDDDAPTARTYLAAGHFFGKEEYEDESSEDTVTMYDTVTSSFSPTPGKGKTDVQRLEAGQAGRIAVGSKESVHGFSSLNQLMPAESPGQRSAAPSNSSSIISDFVITDRRKLVKRLTPINAKEFCAANCLIKAYLVVKIPCSLILNLTVPLADAPWCKCLAVAQAVLIPFLYCFSFKVPSIMSSYSSGDNGSTPYIVTGTMSVTLAALILLLTSAGRTPKFYVIVSAYIGFFTSIAWIYWAAAEVVNVVLMFGNILNIPYQVLGLTVVAWSNSIGDLIADISVARKGFPRMAFAAAIGSPLFNLLIGLGSTFLISVLKTGSNSWSVRITDSHSQAINYALFIGMSVSLLSTLVLLVVRRFRVDRLNGIYLILLYVAFLVSAIVVSVKNDINGNE